MEETELSSRDVIDVKLYVDDAEINASSSRSREVGMTMQLPQAPDRCILGDKMRLHHDVYLRVVSRVVSVQAEPVCAIIFALFFVRSATDDRCR